MTTTLKPPRLLCAACIAQGRLTRLWHWWLGDAFVCRVHGMQVTGQFLAALDQQPPERPRRPARG